MTTELWDMEQGTSNCCGAKVYLDCCSDCKEHCGIWKDELPEDGFSKEQLAIIEKLKSND